MRRALAFAFAISVTAGGVASGGVASAGTRLTLPAPTGPHAVGSTTLHLRDPGRVDPWRGGPRELMATVHYPAWNVLGYPVGTQLTAAEAEAFRAIYPLIHPEVPVDVAWQDVRTHSHVGAPAVPGRRPVLLFSPGAADPRGLSSSWVEELASRGYVVVTIDHPGEPPAVEFPDGSVRGFALPGDPRVDPALLHTLIDTRLADTRSVLDSVEALAAGGNPDVERRPLPRDLARALDPTRIGVFGHSGGGTVAAETLHDDPRVDAAVNLEGYLDWPADQPGGVGDLLPVARDGVDKPLLLVGTDGYRDARYDRSWAAMLAHGTASKRVLTRASHWALTDFAVLAPQLQRTGAMTPAQRVAFIGAVSPVRSVPTVRTWLVTFFDQALRGR
ncbi:alpha/beta hydrolase [Actinosynnema sp. NPDC020468]|uniref:alpha/beta hydrolase n=1 Tax=Actinosynnema sp. NPDC020468 TaxID=3154488 RepID=UPI00340E1100